MTSKRQLQLLSLKEQISLSPTARHLGLKPEDYAQNFRIDGRGSYSAINKKTVEDEWKMQKAAGDIAKSYNKYLTLALLESFEVGAGSCHLPASIAELYARDLTRIESQTNHLPSSFYRLNNDSFVKDLAILSHKLIPVGSEYVVPNSCVPRSILFRKGIAQFRDGVIACLFEAGGFAPYFELHAHKLSLEDFNPDGWQASYARLAELLVLNPEYCGVTSSSWFLDPQLEQVSPHLAYLRTVPEQNGATLLFSRLDSKGGSGALAKSRSRRRLYDLGVYTPAVYTRVWPRSKLIDWQFACH